MGSLLADADVVGRKGRVCRGCGLGSSRMELEKILKSERKRRRVKEDWSEKNLYMCLPEVTAGVGPGKVGRCCQIEKAGPSR